MVSAAGAAKVEVVALRDTRHDLCHALIEEMHAEIHKHTLKKNGEDDVYETVPAICLAIVQVRQPAHSAPAVAGVGGCTP